MSAGYLAALRTARAALEAVAELRHETGDLPAAVLAEEAELQRLCEGYIDRAGSRKRPARPQPAGDRLGSIQSVADLAVTAVRERLLSLGEADQSAAIEQRRSSEVGELYAFVLWLEQHFFAYVGWEAHYGARTYMTKLANAPGTPGAPTDFDKVPGCVMALYQKGFRLRSAPGERWIWRVASYRRFETPATAVFRGCFGENRASGGLFCLGFYPVVQRSLRVAEHHDFKYCVLCPEPSLHLAQDCPLRAAALADAEQDAARSRESAALEAENTELKTKLQAGASARGPTEEYFRELKTDMAGVAGHVKELSSAAKQKESEAKEARAKEEAGRRWPAEQEWRALKPGLRVAATVVDDHLSDHDNALRCRNTTRGLIVRGQTEPVIMLNSFARFVTGLERREAGRWCDRFRQFAEPHGAVFSKAAAFAEKHEVRAKTKAKWKDFGSGPAPWVATKASLLQALAKAK